MNENRPKVQVNAARWKEFFVLAATMWSPQRATADAMAKAAGEIADAMEAEAQKRDEPAAIAPDSLPPAVLQK